MSLTKVNQFTKSLQFIIGRSLIKIVPNLCYKMPCIFYYGTNLYDFPHFFSKTAQKIIRNFYLTR